MGEQLKCPNCNGVLGSLLFGHWNGREYVCATFDPATAALLDEIEALEKKATPGKWTLEGEGGVTMQGTRDRYRIDGPHNGTNWPKIARCAGPGRDPQAENDFALIVALRNALPELLRLARKGAGR